MGALSGTSGGRRCCEQSWLKEDTAWGIAGVGCVPFAVCREWTSTERVDVEEEASLQASDEQLAASDQHWLSRLERFETQQTETRLS